MGVSSPPASFAPKAPAFGNGLQGFSQGGWSPGGNAGGPDLSALLAGLTQGGGQDQFQSHSAAPFAPPPPPSPAGFDFNALTGGSNFSNVSATPVPNFGPSTGAPLDPSALFSNAGASPLPNFTAPTPTFNPNALYGGAASLTGGQDAFSLGGASFNQTGGAGGYTGPTFRPAGPAGNTATPYGPWGPMFGQKLNVLA